MYSHHSIQQVTSNPGIWTALFITAAALGIYYSVILVIRDRGKGRQRSMVGLYTLCTSILLLHLLALLYRDGSASGWMQIAGFIALFLMGPLSHRMMIDRPKSRGVFRFMIPLIPATLILGFLVFDLIDESTVYALGVVYTGVCLVSQAFSLMQGRVNSGSMSWNKWYTAIQIFLFTGIGISCLSLPELLVVFLASAGLAILILLTWIRLLYIAYLSYVISRS